MTGVDPNGLQAARSAIKYLSHPETPWTDEQVAAVITAYLAALTPLKGAPAVTEVREAVIVAAMKQSFRDVVAGHSDKLFEDTGVMMPADHVWERYAKAALVALSPTAPELGAVKAPIDAFNGDNVALIQSAKALIALDKKNALAPHGIGNLARELLETFVARLSSLDEADLFWDDENPEESYRDVEDIFDAIGEAATYLKVRRAKSLPDAWVSCVLTDEDASDWIITYHEDEESARKTVQASRLSSAEEPQTDEMQPDKYIAGDFNGAVRGKRP